MKRQPYYEQDTWTSASLHPATRRRFDQAVEHEYVVYKSSEQGCPLRRAFWDWCVRYARPQVTVRMTPKRAIVEMDLISVDREARRFQTDTKEWRFFVWDLQRTIEGYMPRYYERHSFWPGFYTYVRRVPPAQAEPLAQALVAVYARHFDTHDELENRLEVSQ